MVAERLHSYWEGNFSGAMLNFGRVSRLCQNNCKNEPSLEVPVILFNWLWFPSPPFAWQRDIIAINHESSVLNYNSSFIITITISSSTHSHHLDHPSRYYTKRQKKTCQTKMVMLCEFFTRTLLFLVPNFLPLFQPLPCWGRYHNTLNPL